MKGDRPKILVCGGAGYIGSHMVRMLAENAFEPFVLDNLSTGHEDAVYLALRLDKNSENQKKYFLRADLRSKLDLKKLFEEQEIEGVMHFAARSLVGESMQKPALYYENNVQGTLNLLEAMKDAGISKFIFSSTAAVYGQPVKMQALREDSLLQPINPYGKTKLAIEWALADYAAAYNLSSVSLRYFNAAGAHPDADIGERHEPETHLIPNIMKSILHGRKMHVNGDNYPTPDGTCVRDYIHVQDLCKAHLKALNFLDNNKGAHVFNLGSSRGYSIMEILRASEKISEKNLEYEVSSPRAGDPALLIANADKAAKELEWRAEMKLKDILLTAWNWHKKNEVA